ncbi:hypothetical protein T09_5280 [Trichinella sp. T9]|nr:hypothetical protein T09_5280 [Trichinella sp. T9]
MKICSFSQFNFFLKVFRRARYYTLITNNQVPILTVVIRALFVLVTNNAFSGSLFNCDNYCVQANIGPHKFIALSNKTTIREKQFYSTISKTTTLKHTVEYTATALFTKYSSDHRELRVSNAHAGNINFSREQTFGHCQVVPFANIIFASSQLLIIRVNNKYCQAKQ